MRRYPDVQTGPVGEKIIAFVDSYYPNASQLYVTSAYRAHEADGGTWSHHNGQVWDGSPTAAVDFGAYDGVGVAEGDRRMRDFAKWIEDNYLPELAELIHTTPYSDDNGFYVSHGAPSSFDQGTMAAHLNHVHVAFSDASLGRAIAKSTAGVPAPTPPPAPPVTQPAPEQAPAGIPAGSFGVDYAFARPDIGALKGANVTFAFRYLSFENNQTSPKILRNDEALALSQAGIALVSNYEWYDTRCTEGQSAGADDARTAIDQARAAGAPDGKPVYFSVDTDVSPEGVSAYFQGVASVMPVSQIGVYGSYRVVKGLKEAGLVTWCWQTYAWSGGQWYDGNHVEQYQNSQNIGGGDVDFCRNKTSDFGQWLHTSVAGQQQTSAPQPSAGSDPAERPGDIAGPAMSARSLDVKVNDLWANELAGTSGYVANSPSRRASQIACIEKALADKLGEQPTPSGSLSAADMDARSLDVKVNDLWTQEMFGTSGYVPQPSPSLLQQRLDHIEAMVNKLNGG